MSDEDRQRTDADAEIEQEVRLGRKFTANEALARMAGPGAMKGASPVSPVEQAETEVGNWLGRNISDPAGVLRVVLHRHMKGSELLLQNLEEPLVALAGYLQRILASSNRLTELVREVDVEWGARMDERPHFERDGAPPDPDDPYTVESVRTALDKAVKQLSDRI